MLLEQCGKESCGSDFACQYNVGRESEIGCNLIHLALYNRNLMLQCKDRNLWSSNYCLTPNSHQTQPAQPMFRNDKSFSPGISAEPTISEDSSSLLKSLKLGLPNILVPNFKSTTNIFPVQLDSIPHSLGDSDLHWFRFECVAAIQMLSIVSFGNNTEQVYERGLHPAALFFRQAKGVVKSSLCQTPVQQVGCLLKYIWTGALEGDLWFYCKAVLRGRNNNKKQRAK